MHGKAVTIDCSPARLVLGNATKNNSWILWLIISQCTSKSILLLFLRTVSSRANQIISIKRDLETVVREACHGLWLQDGCPSVILPSSQMVQRCFSDGQISNGHFSDGHILDSALWDTFQTSNKRWHVLDRTLFRHSIKWTHFRQQAEMFPKMIKSNILNLDGGCPQFSWYLDFFLLWETAMVTV